MSFYMCPLNPIVARWSSGANGAFSKARTPIAVRARSVRDSLTIGCHDLPSLNVVQKLEIGTNQFHVLKFCRHLGNRPLLLSISYFGSLVDNAFLNILAGYDEMDDLPTVSVKAYRKNVKVFCNSPASVSEDDLLGSIGFTLNYEDMTMTAYSVESRVNGHAGRFLGALYCIAKELGFSVINFEVEKDNIDAKRFYFHTDFGRPLNKHATLWEVQVE